MSKFDDMLSTIESGITDLAKTTAKDYVAELEKDGSDFLAAIQADLQRWTDLLARKKITKAEFKLLLASDRDLLKMKSLTKAGLAKKRVQDLADGILEIVTKAALGLI